MTRRNAERAGTIQQLTVAMSDIWVASHRVAGISRTIEEIAFLRNVLALNARWLVRPVRGSA